MKYMSVMWNLIVSALIATCTLQAVVEKPITIIIPSRNNAKWYKKNIDSVLSQKYSNYRAVYINDCSTDETGSLVREYLKERGITDRWEVIDNSFRRGALGNIYQVVHRCHDEEIMIVLDGDDWLACDTALTRINQAYQDENTWMTYGQFKTYDDNKIGFCRDIPAGIIKNNCLREYDWITSHLRSFYAGLFKQIMLKDLLYKGLFFDVTWDMAFMYPMLEMAGIHAVFISDILYVYNMVNIHSDFRKKLIQQISCKYFVQSKEKYESIPSPIISRDNSLTIIVFSDDKDALHGCLENIAIHVGADHEVIMVCTTGSDYAQKVRSIMRDIKSAHVLLLRDSDRFCAHCSLDDCIEMLRNTHGHAFYMSVDVHSDGEKPPFVSLAEGCDIVAWQYEYGSFSFKRPYDQHGVLYAKETLVNAVNRVHFDSCDQMIDMMNGLQFDYEHVGLCFENAKLKKGVTE